MVVFAALLIATMDALLFGLLRRLERLYLAVFIAVSADMPPLLLLGVVDRIIEPW